MFASLSYPHEMKDAAVDHTEARCAKLTGVACVRPPTCRVGPNAASPGQAGTGTLRIYFYNISDINIEAVAVSQQRDPGTERQDLSPTDPRLASGFARRRGVEIAA